MFFKLYYNKYIYIYIKYINIVFSLYQPVFELLWWNIPHWRSLGGLSVQSRLFLNHAHELHVRIGNNEIETKLNAMLYP